MKKSYILPVFAILLLFLASCSNDKHQTFIKSPVDSLITQMRAVPNYSIILEDMDFDKHKNNYVHKYKILTTKELKEESDTIARDTIIVKLTPFLPVSNQLFKKHQGDLGMEIVSKKNGKVSKLTSPPGYSQYIGNEKYGQWRENNGHSTWHFFGQYMFMSAIFHTMMYPARRSYYRNYSARNMAGRGYYGPSSGGRPMYGTRSKMNTSTNTKSKWNNRSSSFKKKSNSRINRNSSRYSSKSSSRSRSGGFGK